VVLSASVGSEAASKLGFLGEHQLFLFLTVTVKHDKTLQNLEQRFMFTYYTHRPQLLLEEMPIVLMSTDS
jgi:hypothetical protein